MNNKHIMIFAGEKSGENHAFNLIKALRTKFPQIKLSGIGSGKMLIEGFDSIGSITHLNAFQLGFIKRFTLRKKLNIVIKNVSDYAKEHKPDVFIFVGIADDTQYFVVKLLEIACKLNIKTMYYFSPHVWLWSNKKTRKVAHEVDYIFTFFDREDKAYKDFEANTIKVSHPILDELPEVINYKQLRAKYNINDNYKIIALLYGSREKEIKLHTPVLYKTMIELLRENKDFYFISAVNEFQIKNKYLKKIKSIENHKFVSEINDYYNLIANADLSISCSGTATLETALYNTPQVVYYKLGWFDYLIWRSLAFFAGVSDLSIAMPNIILNEKFIPEFIQGRANHKDISKAVLSLLNDDTRQKNKLIELRNHLGEGGGVNEAVRRIVNLVKD